MACTIDSILVILIVCCCVRVLDSANVEITGISETLLCRHCGHKITSSDQLKNIGSKLALRQRNDTILGDKMCLIQLFKNPNGHQFELITAKSASLLLHGKAHLEDSWFPDYAWRIATCPQCGAHLGWFIKPQFVWEHFQAGSKTLLDLVLRKMGSFENPNSNHHDKTEDNKTKKKHSYSFVGLIFPHLIQQNYADSLIITPKAYRG